MPILDLTHEAQGHRIPLRADALGPGERTLVESTWRGRMVNEHVSARVFAGLLPQLMRAGVPVVRQTEAATMIADELRHARLCAGVLASLGASTTAPMGPLSDIPSHDDAPTAKEALFRNILSICCLSETVAVALINAERLDNDDSPIGDVLRTILADEVTHARFGWRMLEETPLDDGELERLSNYLRLALAHLEAHELAHLSPLPAPATAQAFGACDGAAARSIFRDTVEKVILPRLEQHGFAAQQAWSTRSEPWAREHGDLNGHHGICRQIG